MPLWSNEEWRARIGSCWSALGRPFNTRFTRCRGKSRGMLTLHQVATMVIMMMLLIAANVGLAATQGHHKMFINMLLFGDVIMEIHAFRLGLIFMSLVPVIKICVQIFHLLLPLQAKILLGQFYVDLTHCFQLIKYLTWMIASPAIYAVNSVISGVSGLVRLIYIAEPVVKWTESDENIMLYQGSPRRSLMVVIIVIVQLLVTIAVARSIIFFLLLTSGDIEQNPGPCQTTALPICSLFICWKQIKNDPMISPFQHKSRIKVTAISALLFLCASSVKSTLLLKCGDVEQNPGPLSLDVQPEIHQLDLLVNEANGKRIQIIHRIADKWKEVAKSLHFESDEIENIRQDDHFISCWHIFNRWIKGSGRKPTTWRTLIDVLKETNLYETAHELEDIISTADDILTEEHIPTIYHQLHVHSGKWRDIGLFLGFRPEELDTIQSRTALIVNSPQSWLREMLNAWCEWAPGDRRGSSSFSTLEGLKAALVKCGLEVTANDLYFTNPEGEVKTAIDVLEAGVSREGLFHQLCDCSAGWRDIGTHLGFRHCELDNIQGSMKLYTSAPQSWLKTLLDDWLDWGPGDSRGSTSYATLDGLKAALIKCGLETAANNLQGNIIDSVDIVESEIITCHPSNRLSEEHCLTLYCQLRCCSDKWRELGFHLGFREGELDNIRAKPILLWNAPYGYLEEVLFQWLRMHPGDFRGSTNYAHLEALKDALTNCGLGEIAGDLTTDPGEYETASYDQEIRLSIKHYFGLFHQLRDHATIWRDIGAYLGFRRGELDTIQGNLFHLQHAPESWLRALLEEWLMWAPGDDRGSTRYATLEGLQATLVKCGLVAIEDVEVDFGAVQQFAGEPEITTHIHEQSAPLLERDLPYLYQQLDMHSTKWKEIGTSLGFRPGELNNIEARPFLTMDAPKSFLHAMLVDWVEWCPGDSRGSTSRATLEALKEALVVCGLSSTADDLHTDPKNERELNLLLEKEGYVELTVSKLLITGAAGSGKTCTKHILYKLSPPDERNSTELVEQMDRAYVTREIDHDIAYYTKSTDSECDWILCSESHELYSMLAGTVSEEKNIGYHSTVHNLPTDQQEGTPSNNHQEQAIPASSSTSIDQQQTIPTQSSSSVGNGNSSHRKQGSQHLPLVHKSNGKQLLLKKMNDPNSVGKCIHQVHWIHFLDSGGQSAFHDILPAFVHNISVVIFVIKLSESMDEQPFDDYYERNECIGDSKRSPYQVKEIMKSMIQSICSEKNHSKLLIIGTHSDKISTKESLSDKNVVIKSLLRSFIYQDQLHVFCHGSFDDNDILFPLNAKDQDNKSKEEAKTIRKRIVKRCEHTQSLKIPISWFLLEEDLRLIGMKREHGIINKTECQPIADNLHIAKLTDALVHFHRLNIFLYFPCYSSQLSKLVFTKPQIVVTIVSRFVKIAYKLRGYTDDTQFINYSKQGQFTKDLILNKEDIAHFIDPKVGFKVEQMIELLCITFVIAPITKEKYFIPCVLDYCPPEEIKQEISTQCIAPMVIKLPGECIPRGFFCGLVCSLLSKWKLHKSDKVFKNFIHFDIDGEGYTVAIVDSFFYITVHVFGSCGRNGCCKIQKIVKESVKDIIAKHNYENNVFRNDSVLLLCPCDKQPDHLAQLILEEDFVSDKEILRLKCAMHNNQQLDVTKEHAVWFTEEQYLKWSKQTQANAPTLRELQLLKLPNGTDLRIMKEVAPEWDEVAMALGFDGARIKTIKMGAHYQPKEACREMFSKWLDGGHDLQPPTWNVLIQSLRAANLTEIANLLSRTIEIEAEDISDSTSSTMVVDTESQEKSSIADSNVKAKESSSKCDKKEVNWNMDGKPAEAPHMEQDSGAGRNVLELAGKQLKLPKAATVEEKEEEKQQCKLKPHEMMKEVIASIPRANQWKLDEKIDFENLNKQGQVIPRHLGTIASSMIHWDGSIADELGLTQTDRFDIVRGRYCLDPEMQRREVLIIWTQRHGCDATYRALITAFIKANRRDCADRVCQTLQDQESTTCAEVADVLEYDFLKWLTRNGLSIKDSKVIEEEGITAQIFKGLNDDDLEELKGKLSFGGKRQIGKLHKEVKKSAEIN